MAHTCAGADIMQQATSVQVVTAVTPSGTPPTFQATPQTIQIIAAAAQPREDVSSPANTAASDDDATVAPATMKMVTSASLPSTLSPELQLQLDKDKRAVYS